MTPFSVTTPAAAKAAAAAAANETTDERHKALSNLPMTTSHAHLYTSPMTLPTALLGALWKAKLVADL